KPPTTQTSLGESAATPFAVLVGAFTFGTTANVEPSAPAGPAKPSPRTAAPTAITPAKPTRREARPTMAFPFFHRDPRWPGDRMYGNAASEVHPWVTHRAPRSLSRDRDGMAWGRVGYPVQ